MERHRNAWVGETGDPRENPLTSGIDRHDPHMRKSGSPRWGAGCLTTPPPRPPLKVTVLLLSVSTFNIRDGVTATHLFLDRRFVERYVSELSIMYANLPFLFEATNRKLNRPSSRAFSETHQKLHQPNPRGKGPCHKKGQVIVLGNVRNWSFINNGADMPLQVIAQCMLCGVMSAWHSSLVSCRQYNGTANNVRTVPDDHVNRHPRCVFPAVENSKAIDCFYVSQAQDANQNSATSSVPNLEIAVQQKTASIDICGKYIVIRLLASHLYQPDTIPGGFAPRFSHVGIVPDDAACRWVFFYSGISRSLPFLSGAAPYSARFTLIGSQDLVVKSRQNIFTHSLTATNYAFKTPGPRAVYVLVTEHSTPLSGCTNQQRGNCESYKTAPALIFFVNTRAHVSDSWRACQWNPPFPFLHPGAAVAERLDCSPPNKVIRVKSRAGSLRIFASGNLAGRYRWWAGFLGYLPVLPSVHYGTASCCLWCMTTPNSMTHSAGTTSRAHRRRKSARAA
ncbi:hypothetical protein PR048_017412 [Dryococelus australis]|uniref:Uncharacterized protein n=1 Tax=Dryococelus australis TaxID=614101 RepID=A0ABQ9H9G5_9NEOP|nr:hypothetical protein PR048_017412 [Dryococelus australis]